MTHNGDATPDTNPAESSTTSGANSGATPPDATAVTGDPEALRAAHSRYGSMLRTAGLPFDQDEFDESAPADAHGEAADSKVNEETAEASSTDRPS